MYMNKLHFPFWVAGPGGAAPLFGVATMSAEVIEAIVAYLAAGDRSGFGRRDPWRKICGGGGVTALATALAKDVTDVDDCPDEDTEYSAMLFGKLVGASELDMTDITAIRFFMEVAFAEKITSYVKGLSIGKAVVKAAAEKEEGSHGGKVPNKAEADAIFAKKGMPWQEVLQR